MGISSGGRRGIQQMKRAVTIRDVAALARVSVGTVSAVLNRQSTVSEGTRQRVMESIEALSYKPNSNARSLKRPRLSSIGLIVPDLQNPFFSSIAEGVQDILEEHDILLVLCMTGGRAEREQYYAQALQSARLDGVIYLTGSGVPSPSLMRLAKSKQIILVDESVPGVVIPFVGTQNRHGAFLLARHVLSQGHRKVGIIGGPPRLWTSEQRLAGYREAMAASGLDPDSGLLAEGEYDEASGYRLARVLLETDPELTVLLCANDLMAIGAIRYCREAGIDVPADVSITGFDNIATSSLLEPALTTVAQPGHEMGQAAAALLLHHIKGTAPPETVEFPTRVCLRDSVAPPRRRRRV
ncbi:MAG: LacI family DNA-binding transcriptional regulator [Gluconacetobacter sp.]|uniref:LacI family DNA-binding transcriptional regulator n=1 Tax=Gluconacetobacter dulcium TaxID=2729096 RepID=A0A7W4PFQ9_9PROT|nr:LacI family DNA-binding transcriptional regulator [Gluconacetobacter dulcium]MBB2195893.1 LacI family DNA-binding transcriptional regulator [Gluconacetobacter dulcium]